MDRRISRAPQRGVQEERPEIQRPEFRAIAKVKTHGKSSKEAQKDAGDSAPGLRGTRRGKRGAYCRASRRRNPRGRPWRSGCNAAIVRSVACSSDL